MNRFTAFFSFSLSIALFGGSSAEGGYACEQTVENEISRLKKANVSVPSTFTSREVAALNEYTTDANALNRARTAVSAPKMTIGKNSIATSLYHSIMNDKKNDHLEYVHQAALEVCGFTTIEQIQGVEEVGEPNPISSLCPAGRALTAQLENLEMNWVKDKLKVSPLEAKGELPRRIKFIADNIASAYPDAPEFIGKKGRTLRYADAEATLAPKLTKHQEKYSASSETYGNLFDTGVKIDQIRSYGDRKNPKLVVFMNGGTAVAFESRYDKDRAHTVILNEDCGINRLSVQRIGDGKNGFLSRNFTDMTPSLCASMGALKAAKTPPEVSRILAKYSAHTATEGTKTKAQMFEALCLSYAADMPAGAGAIAPVPVPAATNQ